MKGFLYLPTSRFAKLEKRWSDALDNGCPSCGEFVTDCDHIEGFHHALGDLRASLWRIDSQVRWEMRWWKFKALFKRCPECHHWPDTHDDKYSRWEDDRVAQMLGSAKYGCPRCGNGCTEEREAAERDRA
jgi:hypothetical protein